MTILVELDAVTCLRDGKAALRDITLQVSAGEVVGLVGPNGAGKSTLLRLLIGLAAPSSGVVRVFGCHPFLDPMPVRARSGYAAESRDEHSRASIGELLSLHGCLYPRFDRSFAQRLLGPLAANLERKVHTLSKGQASRVSLACAMAHHPELLLLDEPAGGLDPSLRREFLEHAVELMIDSGSTMILSSHHLADVERIASRIVLLDAGRLRLDTELDSLREDYCVASSGIDPALDPTLARHTLERLEGFSGLRVRSGQARAVFRAPPEAARAALSTAGFDAICAPSNLEEIYITLLGETL